MVSCVAMMVFVVVFVPLLGCHKHIGNADEADLDEFCASIITMGPDGHYLLNWRMITKNNTDQVNRCIEALGIRNVRVARNLSDLRHYE